MKTPQTTPISAVVLTHNSQATLKSCLNSVSWCSEIIVIDDYSTDSTLQIAKQHQTRIYRRHLNNDWAAQRNFSLPLAQNNWIFFVDSDEIVTPKLRQEIQRLFSTPTTPHGYFVPRQDYFLGKNLRHGETSSIRLLRLANRRFGHWTRPVHEVWTITGPTGQLQNPLQHRRNLTISQFIDRLNTYTSLDKTKFHPTHLCKPLLKFFHNYILRLGFLDGFAGFIMAYLMSLHSLTVRVKSWED